MYVLKRDLTEAEFDKKKIERAILQAMKNGSGIVKPKIAADIADEIYEENKDKEELSIYEIEKIVFDKLITKKQRLTARAYEGYRSIREFQRETANTIDNDIDSLIEDQNEYWKDENANKNPVLNTTKRDYMAGIVSTDAVRRALLPPDIIQAHDDGIIHFHDADYFLQKMYNCCVFNLDDMLQNGTVISEVLIEKPKSFQTACTVATQIIAQVASAQYGGQTISLAHLAPFVEVSRQKIRKQVKEELQIAGLNGASTTAINEITEKRLRDEIRAGIQTIQYQLTTIMTTNGQSPFVSLFMYLNEAKNEREKKDLAILIEEVLLQRIQGVKSEDGIYIAPAFPKLLYVTEEDNISEDQPYWYLTKLAAECTTKRLVPDYISEKIMLEYKGDVYPCMGCVEGSEIITYTFNNDLYVEAFERMWARLSDYFVVKEQFTGSNNLYMDLSNVKIYDTEKGFVDVYRLIRNVSTDWIDVHLSNGRRIRCTSDHPFEIVEKGVVHGRDLCVDDKVLINSKQFSDNKLFFDNNKAWLLGFLLCDGCYSSGHIFASIASSGEDDIQEKFINSVKASFGLDVKIVDRHRGKKGNYKDLYIVSDGTNKLHNTINYLSNKYEGVNKKDRHVPNEVFSWTVDAQLSFLAGMIDADGYINSSVIQIGSTNKELALQQMALAQTLGMPARMYYNHYKQNYKDCIRYRIEFYPSEELLEKIVCQKKINNYVESSIIGFENYGKIMSVTSLEMTAYSYDVTTASEHFEVSGLYSHNCRSFLTPDDFTDRGVGNIANAGNYEPGKHKYYGRFNQGVVTINLPDIALSSEGDMDTFWELFEERTELCHRALRLRHERLLGTTSDVAPMLWRYGAIARLDKHEKIDRLLYDGYSTISLGYAGLYECVKYMTGHSHSDEGEGETFGLKVMQALNDKCKQWREAENIAYSLYGTPLESTTYKFAKKLQERFGVIEGITDRNYITNSYHIPVFEEINAFEKLRKEAKFQKLSPGGAISYIETANMIKNVDAILSVIKYMYENIMYAEINTKSCHCEKCQYNGDIPLVTNQGGKLIWECPSCGNRDTSTMDIAFRVCGYIGTAKNGGNQGRYGDIHDRVMHL